MAFSRKDKVINGTRCTCLGLFPVAIERKRGGFSVREMLVWAPIEGGRHGYVIRNYAMVKVLNMWNYKRVNGSDEMIYDVYAEDVYVLFLNPDEHKGESARNEREYERALEQEERAQSEESSPVDEAPAQVDQAPQEYTQEYTLVKDGTSEEYTVRARDVFQAREIASLQYAIPVWQLSWKRPPVVWERPVCEMSIDEARALNSPYSLPAIDAGEPAQDLGEGGKSCLQIEQELLDNGIVGSEDELSRFYPNIVGNGHSSVCLCPQCAPDEYESEEPAPVATESPDERLERLGAIWDEQFTVDRSNSSPWG